MTVYTFVNVAIKADLLDYEIVNDSTIGDFYRGLEWTTTRLKVMFSEELSTQGYDVLESLILSHNPAPTLQEQVLKIVENAENFGREICLMFASENVLLGITQLGLTNHIRKATIQLRDALNSGSLYDAILEIKSLNPNDFDSTIMTPKRLLLAKNKIEEYLNINLTSSWDE